MKHAKAPAGFYTCLDVTVSLANGRHQRYAWKTASALSWAMSNGRHWAALEMTKAKIRGRSKIVGLRIEAVYRRLWL